MECKKSLGGEQYANYGKMFIATENCKAIGMVAGVICEAEDTYCFSSPRRGRITELTVHSKYQGKGVGKALLNEIEKYFSEQKCKCIILDVVAYNESARRFYERNGLFERTVEIMKILD